MRRSSASLLVAAHRFVGGPGHPHRHDGGGLGLHRQVGQHVAHQRLVNQVGAEGLSVLGVVDRAGQTGTHAGGTAQRAVQPGEVDHLDDGRDAAALLADQPCGGAVVFDLTGGVGVVAELVLEPLQEHSVAGAVGQDARQHEAGQPARGLREHQEDVAHRRRGEPLVAGQAVGAVAVGGCFGGAGAHVGAALLLGHRHARGDAGFGGGQLQLGVVFATGQQRLVHRRQFGVVAQRRHHGVGHRDRADVARLDRPHRRLGGADHVRARPLVGPRRGVQTVGDRRAHQLVVGGVVLHLVDAVSVLGRGCAGRAGCGRRARPSAGLRGCRRSRRARSPRPGPTARPRGSGPRSRTGGGRGVVVLQRRNLVGDDVRIWHATNVTFSRQLHKRCNDQRGWSAKKCHSSFAAESGQS